MGPFGPSLGGLVDVLLAAIGHAILSGLGRLAAWALGGAIHSLVASTAVNLAAIAAPWQAMLVVAGLAALPIFLVAVVQAVLRGDPGELARRGLAVPLGVGAGLAAALPLLDGLLAACSWASGLLVAVGGGGVDHMAQVWTRLGAVLEAAGEGIGSTLGMPGAATALLLLVAALAALTIWLEMAVRAALLYLLAALIPLSLAGLWWRRMVPWASRMAEVILAVALSQVVITAALVVGTSVIDQALGHAGGPGPAIGGVVQGVALLLLASFGLPLTLRIVPIAVDAAGHAGAGRRALGWAGGQAEQLKAGIAAPTKVSAGQRLATAPVRVVAGVAVRARTASNSAGERDDKAAARSEGEGAGARRVAAERRTDPGRSSNRTRSGPTGDRRDNRGRPR